MATEDVLVGTRGSGNHWLALAPLYCAGPDCQACYAAGEGAPEGWMLLTQVGSIGFVRRFCSLPCLIRWAGEQV